MLDGTSKVSVFYAAVPSSADMMVGLAELLDDAERGKQHALPLIKIVICRLQPTHYCAIAYACDGALGRSIPR